MARGSAPMSGPTVGARLLWRWRRFVLGSCDDGRLQQYNQMFPPCFILLVCIPTLYRDVEISHFIMHVICIVQSGYSKAGRTCYFLLLCLELTR
jgi:hypothetical protein